MSEPTNKNLLSSLLEGGDSSIKLITLALVVISGGGNFFATKQSSEATDREVGQAIREIHDLHDQLGASMQRQKEMHEMLQQLSKQQKAQ